MVYFSTLASSIPKTVLAEAGFAAVITPTIGAVEEPVPPRVIGTLPEVIF